METFFTTSNPHFKYWVKYVSIPCLIIISKFAFQHVLIRRKETLIASNEANTAIRADVLQQKIDWLDKSCKDDIVIVPAYVFVSFLYIYFTKPEVLWTFNYLQTFAFSRVLEMLDYALGEPWYLRTSRKIFYVAGHAITVYMAITVMWYFLFGRIFLKV